MDDSRSTPSADAATRWSVAAAAATVSAQVTLHCAPTLPRRWLVAFSGGADSTALLLAARQAAPGAGATLAAIHVHHGLHAAADAWAAHCQCVADRLEVPLRVVKVSVRPAGAGIEAAARDARYQAFSEADADLLLLAHHRDDQAEGILLHLFRGAGVHGAAGMPALRELPRAKGAGTLRVLRPLLGIPGSRLRDLAASVGLSWIEDPSNRDQALARSYLRTCVLPGLAAVFPAATALIHAGERFREAAGLLDELAEADLLACAEDGRLSGVRLRDLSAARQRNALYRALTREGVRVASAARLEELRRQLVGALPDDHAWVSFGEREAHVWRQILWIVASRGPGAAPVRWLGEPSVAWAGGRVGFCPGVGEGLSASRMQAAVVTIRARQGGERVHLGGNRPRQRLKLLWQAAGVPPWERARLPLLWVNEDLAWVPGFPVHPSLRAGVGEPGWTPVWLAAERMPGQPPD